MRKPETLPFPKNPKLAERCRRCAFCGKTGGLVPLARSVLDEFGNLFNSGYAHPSCFRKVRDDFDKADQRWNTQ